MAIINKIHSADFADDTATADVERVTWLIKDDVDSEYIGGTVVYDFVNSVPSAQGIRSLSEIATIKTEIDAMIASRAKNTISLPTLVKSITEKDGSGSVTKYTERY